VADELADGLFVGVVVDPESCRVPAGADALSVWPTMASTDCSTVVSMRWATLRLPHVFGGVVPSGEDTEHAVIDVGVYRAIEAVAADLPASVGFPSNRGGFFNDGRVCWPRAMVGSRRSLR
jgi:hypothetical protein